MERTRAGDGARDERVDGVREGLLEPGFERFFACEATILEPGDAVGEIVFGPPTGVFPSNGADVRFLCISRSGAACPVKGGCAAGSGGVVKLRAGGSGAA
mmetsp:Transcript_119549/g.338349  ORF Transcript_119549/g.338349 Transcript_119549/m.338349 type:complete len:100 (+) Transcript_119549:2067-2366(+)